MTTWNLNGTKKHVLICNGSSCMRKEGEEITLAIRDEIKIRELDQQIHTSRTRCNGRCKDACVVVVYPEGNWYSVTSSEVGRSLIKSHQDSTVNLKDSLIYSFDNDEMKAINTDKCIKGISKVELEGAKS
ncbi:(2Fe-2S) ferredoxin domain-containing protein [Alkalihalophilus lindianensis]|uniref:(2Fe-2S) ferredoxin domain-containing protein n=1 Tax=Alkalihalophilus lindianensis TaxID=1630542 RepID=A0ABU3XD01_9BACI|nr:(2Fe-2S) ferredoxin domain-containing protein [Alkalihalophilus lindianensis]MDV2685203.1 (2Fe-2S) ferredoxin domain-containing protein [Alkalihalophilus lindianensis]